MSLPHFRSNTEGSFAVYCKMGLTTGLQPYIFKRSESGWSKFENKNKKWQTVGWKLFLENYDSQGRRKIKQKYL